jgi:HPt (histidine-containing phosphotransfer) domain-containing protein
VTLDGDALARLRQLDPDGRHGVLQRVLGAFETSLDRMLAQLAAELERPQAAPLGNLAHTLKSSSASVGALRLSAACDEVERRVRLRGEPAQRHDVEQLLAEGRAALAAVRAILHP